MIIKGVIGQIILTVTGWKIKAPSEFSQRMVVVIWPHKSYVEAFYLLMAFWYLKSKTNIPQNITLMTPWMFTNPVFRTIASLYGGIPATPLSNEKGGQTSLLISLLKDKSFCFTIAPAGALLKNTWRTGWKVIAKETEADVYHVYVKFSTNEIILYKCESTDHNVIEQDIRDYGKVLPISYVNTVTFGLFLSSAFFLVAACIQLF